VGDWYVYKDYIEIRIYGSKVPPYQLLIFLPIRIFALEYIWQRINLDLVHFVPRKHEVNFKLMGPFNVDTR